MCVKCFSVVNILVVLIYITSKWNWDIDFDES